MAPTFAPDGWDAQLRVGLLVPDGDIGPESEWSAITPPDVAVHASRFRFPVGAVEAEADMIATSPVEFVAAPGPLDDAIKLLNPPSIDVYSLAFTSTSYVGDDSELADRLSALAHGKPVVTTGQALLAAVDFCDAQRVMLVDPPWFPADLTALGKSWLERNNVTVVKAQAAELPSGQGNIHAQALYEWMCSAVDGIDLVLVGGNGFRAVGAVQAVEESAGVPVVTANTALLWHTLRTVGQFTSGVTNYGQIFMR